MKRLFAVLLIVTIPSTSLGNPKILPEGTKVTVEKPGKEPAVLNIHEETHFIIARSMMDRATAADKALDTCKNELVSCEKSLQLEQRKKQETTSAFLTGLKWAGFGGAVVGAFVLGMVIR